MGELLKFYLIVLFSVTKLQRHAIFHENSRNISYIFHDFSRKQRHTNSCSRGSGCERSPGAGRRFTFPDRKWTRSSQWNEKIPTRELCSLFCLSAFWTVYQGDWGILAYHMTTPSASRFFKIPQSQSLTSLFVSCICYVVCEQVYPIRRASLLSWVSCHLTKILSLQKFTNSFETDEEYLHIFRLTSKRCWNKMNFWNRVLG